MENGFEIIAESIMTENGKISHENHGGRSWTHEPFSDKEVRLVLISWKPSISGFLQLKWQREINKLEML